MNTRYGFIVVMTTALLCTLPVGAKAQSASADADTQPTASAPMTADAAAPGGDKLRPFCTDRPTKSNGACTVDQGHFQIESDIYNASFSRQDGVNTNTYLDTSPTLKYGLTNTTDLQVNWAPYESVRTHDTRTGAADTVSGVGDLYVRAKFNLIGNDSGNFAASLFPYVKAPTARSGIGDGAWEGGLVVPLVFKLSDAVSLTFDPEVDLLKNTVGGGVHANMAQLADISWTIKSVTLFGEIWSNVNFDPTGTVTQYSTDYSIAWVLPAVAGLPQDLQLDAGVNFGLNRVTPSIQVYTGISHRF